MIKQQYIITAVITLIFTGFAMPLPAQPSLPSPPGSAPIDGRLNLLMAAGAGYGVKKLQEKRNKQEGNN